MPRPIHPIEAYSIGIICALGIEKAAVDAVLDEEHGSPKRMAGDDNSYAFGKIGEHNVVTACLPAGVMGKVSATTVAKDMMRSFPIKVGFMVGVGGGMWSEQNDVRLGDVVVSEPHGVHGGVVQWDFGKMQQEGVFERTGTLNKPPRALLSAVQNLKAVHERKDSEVAEHLTQMLHNNSKMRKTFSYPGRHHDRLFEASYQHPSGDDCTGCDRSKLLQHRPDRDDDTSQIHYGNIASGDEVMKDGPTRDRIAREEEILCFEMEAAGLMDTFPCVVIRGVCDYADSHKNKRWQRYAAAIAACYCKELLGMVDHQGIAELSQAKLSAKSDKLKSTRSAHHGSGDIVNYAGSGNQENHRYKISGGSGNMNFGNVHNHLPQERPKTPPEPSSNVPFHPNPQFVERAALTAQIRAKLSVPAGTAALVGLGGVGKSQLAIEYARQLQLSTRFDFTMWFRTSARCQIFAILPQRRFRFCLDVMLHVFKLWKQICERPVAQSRLWLVIVSFHSLDDMTPSQHGGSIVFRTREYLGPGYGQRYNKMLQKSHNIIEASTIIDNEMWYPTNFSHHQFEYDHIVKVRDDECLIQWTDSQISSSDLKFGLLDGVPIYTWVEHTAPLGAGLVNVTWKLTWEPKTTFTSHLHSMDQDPRLCATEEMCADWVMQSYSPCILHESLLDEAYLHKIPLRDAVLFADAVDGGHGLLYITWKEFMVELEAVDGVKLEQ